MELKDFMDLSKLQKIQDAFSDATGLAAIAVGKNGEYITEGSNFTDFCMKYTRNSVEGNRRCVKCDNECTGTYYCHAGLMDFAIVGGQVLPQEPEDEKFRQTARELGINEDAYVQAVHQVPVSTEKRIRASAELLGEIVNQLVNLEYFRYTNGDRFTQLHNEVMLTIDIIQDINANTHSLKSIANKQKMLSLNASIEAARSGEAGVGFAVVAKSMGELSSQSATIYGDIEKSVAEVTKSVNDIAALFEQ
ncbi:PocR ligand-binding domain-containing protein [Jutongia sp.]|uniref:PocR ligand-binding domain-containing protein n=1 Tax=Jutongia sp. TaxID=2944204 RepID=UPI0030798BE6